MIAPPVPKEEFLRDIITAYTEDEEKTQQVLEKLKEIAHLKKRKRVHRT